MKNSCQFKMSKIVKPLQVSPAIKAARWFLLICGIFHGSSKLNRYREIEKTEHVIREEKLRLQHEELVRITKEKTIEEVINVAREFEITEFPPDWDKDL